MNMHMLTDELNDVIKLAKEETKNIGPYGFLPDIVQLLEQMRDCIAGNLRSSEHRSRMVGGLTRLVTETRGLAESELGTRILEVGERFARSRGSG